MKHLLHHQGVNSAKYAFRSANGTLSLDELGMPFIAKPADGRGSRNISLVCAKDATLELQSKANAGQYTSQIFEEFVDPDTYEEFHVDTVWEQGEVIGTFLGKYEQPPRKAAQLGVGNASAYFPERCLDRQHQSIIDFANSATMRVGVRSGVSHTECFVSKGGDLLLGEIASSPAGGGHNTALEYVTGFSLRTFIFLRKREPRWRRCQPNVLNL